MLAILDVLIGLVFVYGLFSVLVSAATELLMAFVAERGKTLWMAVKSLLPSDASLGVYDVANEFLKHPLIGNLGAAEHDIKSVPSGFNKLLHKLQSTPEDTGKRAQFPSYLPPTVFVDALMNILRHGNIRHGHAQPSADVPALINDVANDHMRNTLQALHQSSVETGTPFRSRLEQWFNDSMDRATGWYKRTTQIVLFLVAIIMAVWCNVDTLHIVTTLSGNKELRNSIAETAAAYANKQLSAAGVTTPTSTDAKPEVIKAKTEQFNVALQQINSLGLPIGWGPAEKMYVVGAPMFAFLGWMMSALAATMGANFWFQILGSLVKMRIAGNKPTDAPPAPNPSHSSPTSPGGTLAYAPVETLPPPAGFGVHAEPVDEVAAVA